MNFIEVPSTAYQCGQCKKVHYSKNSAESCCQCCEESCTAAQVTNRTWNNFCAKHERAHNIKKARGDVYNARNSVESREQELQFAKDALARAEAELILVKGTKS
jgi:hypothetical protein